MTLEEFREQHRQELDERHDAGVCGCGCGTTVRDRRGRRRYVDERHKHRAHRARLQAEAKLLGVPAHLSVKNLETAERTSTRSGDAQTGRQRPPARRSPRPGVSVYLPRAELVERVLSSLEYVQGLGIEHAGERELNAEAIAALERARDRRTKRLARERARPAA